MRGKDLRRGSGLLPFLILGSLIFSDQGSAIQPTGDKLNVGLNIPHRELNLKKQISLSKGEVWQEFTSQHPNWSVLWNEETETPHRAAGNPIRVSGSPSEETARRFIEENQNLFWVDERNLMLLRGEKHGKIFYFTFQETYKGIPVTGGRVDLRLDKDGKIILLGADTHPDIQISITPSVLVDQAIETVKNRVNFNSVTDVVKENRLVILPSNGKLDPEKILGFTYHLAWEIRMDTVSPLGRWVAYVDAHTGELLVLYNRVRSERDLRDVEFTSIQNDTIFGKVTGMIHPLFGTSPLSEYPFQGDRILARGYGGNTGISDINGDYFIPVLGTNPRTITTYLVGPFIFVTNDGGGEATYSGSATPGTPHDILWDSTLSLHSERDCFYHTHVVHDWLKRVDPGFTDLDYSVPCRVNVSGVANAFWDGYGMIFGDGGIGSDDFGEYADVIYHEYGHGVTDYQYRPLDPSGAMHEGFSDYLGCTVTNEPLIGEILFTPYLRDLDNDLRCPENLRGESHADGEIIAGALWHMREGLANSPLADSLFHFARYGFPGSPFQEECQNFFDYLLEIYLVDDDDGDLSNGTPHLPIIHDAFLRHGIGPELELEGVAARERSPLPDIVFDPGDTVEVVVAIRLSKHLMIPATNVTGVLSSDSLRQGLVTVIKPNANFSDIDTNGTGDNGLDPFRFLVSDTLTDVQDIQFTMELSAMPFFYNTSFTFTLRVGHPSIIIVDDDEGLKVERYYEEPLISLDSLSLKPFLWDVELRTSSPKLTDLSLFPIVIWLTGDAGTNTLTPEDQDSLSAFLDSGGKLFISGQNIGEEIGGTPFYQNYLRASYLMGNANNNILSGVPGDEIGDGLSLVIQGSNGAGNANSEDKISPLPGADSIFTYTSAGGTSALKYDSGIFKMVYFAFPFEAIHGTGPYASREIVMERIIAWFDSTLVGVEEVPSHFRFQISDFRLFQNRPNPFYYTTLIRYQIARSEKQEAGSKTHVHLSVYDITGRLVKTLVDERQEPGVYQLPISNHQLPGSGIYFYRLQIGNFSDTKKLIFFKSR